MGNSIVGEIQQRRADNITAHEAQSRAIDEIGQRGLSEREAMSNAISAAVDQGAQAQTERDIANIGFDDTLAEFARLTANGSIDNISDTDFDALRRNGGVSLALSSVVQNSELSSRISDLESSFGTQLFEIANSAQKAFEAGINRGEFAFQQVCLSLGLG